VTWLPCKGPKRGEGRVSLSLHRAWRCMAPIPRMHLTLNQDACHGSSSHSTQLCASQVPVDAWMRQREMCRRSEHAARRSRSCGWLAVYVSGTWLP
jgi:hypothetical protein